MREATGRVSGKIAIVTGAASGIGLASARALAQEGATVVLTDRDVERGRAVADGIGGFRALDVTDEAAWENLVGEVGRVDVLVNAAGIGVMADLVSTTLEMFRLTMAVNVEGVFLGCRAVWNAMKEAGGGSIVNVSSVAGIVADPGLAAYCASKGAVRMLSKSIALQGARHKIRCNSVHPSFIDTPMVDRMVEELGADARDKLTNAAPLRRLGRAEEVAALILYLASDEASFTTGAEHIIDGGLTAR